MSAPYRGWLKVTFFQYFLSSSSKLLYFGGLYLQGTFTLPYFASDKAALSHWSLLALAANSLYVSAFFWML